jgi:hypothetical protein
METDLRGRVSCCLGGEFPERVAFLGCELLLGRDAGRFPAAAQLGQGQIGSELPAAEPHQTAVPGGVAGLRDGVPGDLGGVTRAQPLADQQPGAVESGEEFLLAGCSSGSGADRTLERDPRRFLPSAPPGLLVLGAGRMAGCSSVAGGRRRSPYRSSAARHASRTR